MHTDLCYASWGPIFLETPRNPDNEKAPGPKLTIKQLKEACKWNGSPVRGTNDPVSRTRLPVKGTEALLIVENAFNCNGSPYLTALIVGSRAELLRKGQIIGPQLA